MRAWLAMVVRLSCQYEWDRRAFVRYACGTSTVRGLVVIPNRPPRLAQIERCANEGFPNIRELSGSTREETASRPESTRTQA